MTENTEGSIPKYLDHHALFFDEVTGLQYNIGIKTKTDRRIIRDSLLRGTKAQASNHSITQYKKYQELPQILVPSPSTCTILIHAVSYLRSAED